MEIKIINCRLHVPFCRYSAVFVHFEQCQWTEVNGRGHTHTSSGLQLLFFCDATALLPPPCTDRFASSLGLHST